MYFVDNVFELELVKGAIHLHLMAEILVSQGDKDGALVIGQEVPVLWFPYGYCADGEDDAA